MGFGSPRKVPNATWNIRLASDKSFASSGRTITPACIALNLSAASLQRFGKLVQRADPRHGRDAVFNRIDQLLVVAVLFEALFDFRMRRACTLQIALVHHHNVSEIEHDDLLQ